LGILCVITLFFILTILGAFGKLPSLKELENPEADLASEVYTSDGKLMGKYYAENRSEVKYNELSPNTINALIATEDERFIEHSGIDGRAVARAVFSVGKQGGGSTLTQQLAKMMLGQGKGNMLVRGFQKMKEWIVAVKLERNFTKEEIITLYLNRAAWGSNYGIRNASRTYYQKEPKNLTLLESAVLVGMLKGFIYDPVRHPKASLDRRNVVIDQMANAGYISVAESAKLKSKPLITNYRKPEESLGIAPHFRMVLADKMRQWCKSHTNPKTGKPYDLYRDGLKIHTTINSTMQEIAEEAVYQHQPVIQRKLNATLKYNSARMWKNHENVIEAAMKSSERWKNLKEEQMSDESIGKTFRVPVKMKVFAWNTKRERDTVMSPYDSIRYHREILQSSFVAMEPNTGEIKCWVGGNDFNWFKFDHVTAQRQVGSTFKPLLYALAVKDAGYTPETYIAGGPLTLSGKTISTGGGTMAYCLAKSLNGAAWRLMSVIGVKQLIEFAQLCGIKTKLPPYPSIALGVGEIPLLEMLQSYTMFPNKGFNTEPLLIQRIEDKSGNLIAEFSSEPRQILNENDAYTMVKLMQGVVKYGTGRSLSGYNIPVECAGKTGTTNGNADGWFIGYTPELLAGTWLGCDDPFIRIYSTGGGSEMALPKWGYFMKKVYADKKLPYGKIDKFVEPVSMENDPIYADDAFASIVQRGHSEVSEDQGNGEAGDFIEIEEEPAESLIDPMEDSKEKPAVDTSTKKKPSSSGEQKSEQPKKSAPARPNTESSEYRRKR
jgi:penicillin-binding protein 1A